MKRALLLALALLLPIATQQAGAQAPSAPPQVAAAPQVAEETAIRSAIAVQADAWNHADIPAFMQTYENSPDTTFIGAHVAKGYQPILERYSKNYSTKEQMGTLTFSNVDIRFLPSSCGAVEYAVVTGNFHLERAAHGEAKKDDGIFSLVWRKGPQGWKILLDHTS